MMNGPSIHWVESAGSTNTFMASRADAIPHGTVIAATEQTAGRGQRGNSWEAEPGKNLTFSILLRPQTIKAARQFEMSMIVSIAIASALEKFVPGKRVKIKWPNDIYIDDRKICGILIENTLMGDSIDRSIVGIGINVNQAVFRSDAPNPSSLLHYTGRELPLDPVLEAVASGILRDLAIYEASPEPEQLNRAYFSRLWRSDAPYLWRDNIRNENVYGRIARVAADGMLTLAPSDGSDPRIFAFKEIAAIL